MVVGLVLPKRWVWLLNSICSVYFKLLSPHVGKVFTVDFVWSVSPAFICISQIYIYIYFYLSYSFGCCLEPLDIVYSIFDHTNISVGSCNLLTHCVCNVASVYYLYQFI
jgi:hypothetical protein